MARSAPVISIPLDLFSRHDISLMVLSNEGASEISCGTGRRDSANSCKESHNVSHPHKPRRGGDFLDAVPIWWSAHADVALLVLIRLLSNRGSRVPPVAWANVLERQLINVTTVDFP